MSIAAESGMQWSVGRSSHADTPLPFCWSFISYIHVHWNVYFLSICLQRKPFGVYFSWSSNLFGINSAGLCRLGVKPMLSYYKTTIYGFYGSTCVSHAFTKELEDYVGAKVILFTCQIWWQLMHSVWGECNRVLLSSVTDTVFILSALYLFYLKMAMCNM